MEVLCHRLFLLHATSSGLFSNFVCRFSYSQRGISINVKLSEEFRKLIEN